MDSPLLPTLGRSSASRGRFEDDSDLLGDLSLEDEVQSASSAQKGPSAMPTRPTAPTSASSSTSKPPPKPPAGGRRPPGPRFSLFARPAASAPVPAPPAQQDEPGDETMMAASHRARADQEGDEASGEVDEEEALGEDQTMRLDRQQESSADRDQKLQTTLFELRKMNEVFEGMLGALEGVKGHNERLAERTSQTSALLDQYIALLGQAEHTQRLVLNEQWQGGQADAVHALQQQQAAVAAERQRLEEEEAAREEAERQAAERAERAKAAGTSAQDGRGGARGRGTVRGSGLVRGARGRVTSGSGMPSGIRKPSGTIGTTRGTGISRGK